MALSYERYNENIRGERLSYVDRGAHTYDSSEAIGGHRGLRLE